ncbi:MAG: hypothetical protein HON68_07790 [Gammaproteobacteria bacterium]|jgi:hypothetical protein|nr:hypothetical protein [Gammaproteobacteria bacterium]
MGKVILENFRRLDIYSLNRDGVLSRHTSSVITWRNHTNQVMMTTTITPTLTQSGLVDCLTLSIGGHTQQITVNYYHSNYGGQSPLFLMGAHRTRYIYHIPEWGRWVTRHDFKNRYFKEHESHHMRARDQAFKLRARLGLPVVYPQCYDPVHGWDRPKGMHLATFNRIRTKIDSLLQVYYRGMLAFTEGTYANLDLEDG